MRNIDDPLAKNRLSSGFQTTNWNRKKMKSENFPIRTFKDRCIEATCQI